MLAEKACYKVPLSKVSGLFEIGRVYLSKNNKMHIAITSEKLLTFTKIQGIKIVTPRSRAAYKILFKVTYGDMCQKWSMDETKLDRILHYYIVNPGLASA